MQGAQKRISEKDPSGNARVWAAILAGLKYLWDDKPLRLMFLVITALNFLFVGPLLVGIPVLASQRLTEGAVAFGLLMSAFAGGNLVGYLLAGSLPRPNSLGMRLYLIVLMTIFGLVLCSLGFISSTWLDFSLMLLIGLGNGYISIIMFTWMQKRTPKEMLGRMMAMMMLSNTGLVPISQAISGAVSKLSLTALFVGAGVLVLLLTVVSTSRPEMIAVSEDMASNPKLAQSVVGDKA
jgi:MFS family permease